MKIEIKDWKLLTNIVWDLEIWYQDNYRRLNNKERKLMRNLINNLTDELIIKKGEKK